MTALATPPKLQFLDANGAPLVGGKLYTYAAGTTTPQVTYTDFGGGTPNANPVILDSRGEASVWLGTALYKMALYSATNVLIWTVDNIGGFATLAQLAASGGSNLIGFLPAGTGAVATTVQAKLRESVSVLDFGASPSASAAANTTAIQNAINYAAPLGKAVYIPAGTYAITALTLPLQHGGIEIYGEAYNSSYNLSIGTYVGTNLVSTQGTGNIISCNGGVNYSNRGIRLRNINISVMTTGFAISLVGAPEMSLLENLTIRTAGANGSGIQLTSCWGNMLVSGCSISSASLGSSGDGISITNAIKAGGVVVDRCSATLFNVGIYVGANVYQCAITNSEFSSGRYGSYVDVGAGVKFDTCHFEFNTENAICLVSSITCLVSKCTFYRNGETASVVKAEIYAAAGGSNYNQGLTIQNCDFFGIGTAVTAIYIANPAFLTAFIQSNQMTAFGTSTVGVYSPSVTPAIYCNLNTNQAATPYNPVNLPFYEEGTFTPTVTGTTGSGPATMLQQNGVFTRIGNVVTFTLIVYWTSIGSWTGNLRFTGLPYAAKVKSFGEYPCSIIASSLVFGPGKQLMAGVLPGDSKAFLVQVDLTTGAANDMAVVSGGAVTISGSYQV